MLGLCVDKLCWASAGGGASQKEVQPQLLDAGAFSLLSEPQYAGPAFKVSYVHA